MNVKKFLALSALLLILSATFASILISLPVMAQYASLTGRIFDHGEDTDSDLLYNFLVVDVEVQVNVAGTYKVSITSLRDQYYNSLYYQVENETYLNPGTYNVSLPFNGIAIYASKINVTMVAGISLVYQVGTAYYSELISDRTLSQTYNYTLFDYGAVLTGTIYDEGIDTDGDGLFNFLEINAEVDVADEAWYQLTVSGLQNVSDSYYETIYISNFTQNYLFSGVQNLTVWLYGPMIYASHAINISIINWIELYFVEGSQQYELNYTSYQPLSRPYRYDEFDTPAYFTGTIFDEGIDEEPNGKFDYLKISVEANVTEPGYYQFEVLDLLDSAFQKILVSDSLYDYFDVGVHLVNLTIYGPKIYMSNLNPRYINSLSIYTFVKGWGNIPTDRLFSIPLSKSYNYTDFESHALLTGNISDIGVDTDGDRLFDYLAVGVEVNVTEAGIYEIGINNLMEKTDGSYRYMYYPQWFIGDFDVGVQTVYLNYSGPRLAYDHFSPTNVSDVTLYEQVYPYTKLSYIGSAPLSQKYDYTLFNAPLNDIEFNFVVYPNGTTAVDGTINYTRMYPQNMGPQVNASISISTTGSVTTGSLGGRAAIPNQWMFGLPLDSIMANFSSKYEGGLSNSTLNLILFVPPEAGNIYPLNATDFELVSSYKNGMLTAELWGETQIPSYETMFPFNATDLTIIADYLNGELVGNITFHLIPGVPMLDVTVNFNGNKTDLYLTDHINVTYGNYFGMEINSTTLEGLLAELNSTIPGPNGLVANMTWKLLECTNLNTKKTEWPDGKGAEIRYNATIYGNFTFFFARLLTQTFIGGGPHEQEEQFIYAMLESMSSSVENASLRLYYYHNLGIAAIDKLKLVCDVKKLWSEALEIVPSTVPPEARTQVEAWLKMANATTYAIQDASFNAAYSSTGKRLYLDAYLLSNGTLVEQELKTILPETVPPPLRPIYEYYLSVTYCNLTYSETTVRYVNGTADFEMNWVVEGDFKAQLNHVKRFYIDYLNATAPWMLNWQLRMLNMTEIDINNFNAEIRMGRDQFYLTFNGVIVKPPIDEIDFIRFKLYKWLNMTTAPDAPPREFEKLKITIASTFNGTHTILLYAPGTVPPPDTTSLDYKSMMWENVTLSSLKDIEFRIAYQQEINYIGVHNVIIFTNSTVNNFGFDPTAKSISFNVTGTEDTGFCNITIPKTLLRAALDDWIVKIDGLPLTSEDFAVTENDGYAFIYLNYTHSEHKIEIVGTWVVAEFPPNMLIIVLIMVSLIATVMAVKQRRKISALKIKYQNTINSIINSLHHLRI